MSFGVTVGLEGGAESVGLAGDGPPRRPHAPKSRPRRRPRFDPHVEHQFKTEGQLEPADHHDRRLLSPQRDQITAADLALDGEAERFEIALSPSAESVVSGVLRRRRRVIFGERP